MTHKEGIGIGGVTAEVAYLTADKKRKSPFISEGELAEALCKRFGVEQERAVAAINLAKQCGVIAGFVRLKGMNGKVL